MISVCIATYNGEKYIKAQLESILAQIGQDDEIIVSDDNSTDNTISEIESLNDNRIKVKKNRKTIKKESQHKVFQLMDKIRLNFENALVEAKGDYIFLADQDDIWKEDKVKSILKMLEDYDCVVHDCEVWNGEKVTINSFFEYFKTGRNLFYSLLKSPFMGCCMAFNKKILNKAIPYPDMHVEHDTYIGLCAFKYGNVGFCDKKLIKYRRHEDNVSPCADDNTNSLYIKLIRRLYMLVSLIKA
jgi:glycosyltransferase involved in cell wall biosynthesis